MKVSYRTHPMLKRLEKRKLDFFEVGDADLKEFNEILPIYNKVWEANCEAFAQSIDFITKPFGEAATRSAGKISEIEGIEEEEIRGTFCFGYHLVGMINKEVSVEDNEIRLTFFLFMDNTPLAISFFDEESKTQLAWSSSVFDNDLGYPNEDKKETLERIIYWVELFSIFKKYADIETTHLKAGQKLKTIDCKYKNETASNIKILNSTWFTSLVKSDGFKVRGHFRLQPVKVNGEWTRKLIWINDFEKTGYTAPARKLQQSA